VTRLPPNTTGWPASSRSSTAPVPSSPATAAA
jgi:hypothetical protein